MSFLEILDTLIIGPLKLIFEVVFRFATELTPNLGVCIAILSLVINLMILPLYMCADAMQERTRKREQELAPSIKHIKSTFKGDERMMMLQTFYKQNNYSPLSALSGAVSLLLEIPFFIAAYSFLSGVAEFKGASLGPIADLSKADGLLTIGSLTVNVLPFIMTIFNVVASILFLKGADLKSKIQLYAMALFFLIFLYSSPSGLLFYWTLNNLFSLIKNIFYKFKKPKTVIAYMLSGIGVLIPILMFAFRVATLRVRLLSLIFTVALQIPLAIYWLRRKGKFLPKQDKVYKPNKKLFILGAAFLSILLGVLIPTACLAASPTEFLISPDIHPMWYVLSSACLSIGLFGIWLGIFYWLASKKGKVIFEKVIWIMAVIMFVNYMFFGKNLGNMSASLQFDNSVNYSGLETTINIIVIVVLAISMFFLVSKFRNVVIGVLAIAIGAISTMSTINIVDANSVLNDSGSTESSKELPYFNISSTGQNVFVLVLDRAMGQQVPYILQERPDLIDTYDGFTYYSNVISFGGHTNYASPALLGGYEYTPVEINKRDGESLSTKQNEANLVIPRILTENQWNNNGQKAKATIFEPMYTNYSFIGDLSVFDEYEDTMKANNIIGKFVDDVQKEGIAKNNFRNFFCYSFMRTMTVPLQFVFYNEGSYNNVFSVYDEENGLYSIQTTDGIYKASGIRAEFMSSYNNLVNLNTMTKIVSANDENPVVENTYTFMANNTTHEPMIMDAKNDYTPAMKVDNTEYYNQKGDIFTLPDGRKLAMDNVSQMQSYHVNVASLLRVGEWLNYLKENGVYDNTRIIIVSDHGHMLDQVSELNYDGNSVEGYYPLLLVKDFNSRGKLTESKEFMTNADVPTLAVQGLVNNPVNPATNKPLNNAEKTAHPQYVCMGTEYSIYFNKGNHFDSSRWASVKDNIWDESNWEFLDYSTVLKEHDFD